jgi:hypothetical protein
MRVTLALAVWLQRCQVRVIDPENRGEHTRNRRSRLEFTRQKEEDATK